MLKSVRVRVTVLLLVAVVLVVEGYFVYKYYDQYYGGGAAPDATAASSSREATTPDTGAADPASQDAAEEATSGETSGNGAAFVHRSAPGNIVDNSTYIDHPSTDEKPEAILLVTQVWGADGEATNPHPIGVWYDANRGGKWAVYNQDLAPMPEGVTFSVVVPESRDEAAVHQAGPANTAGNVTYLDHPLVNGNPNVGLSVTPNWNPGGTNGTYNAHLVGVRYDADEKRWTILNQDLAPMTPGAAFNVSFSDSPGSTS